MGKQSQKNTALRNHVQVYKAIFRTTNRKRTQLPRNWGANHV